MSNCSVAIIGAGRVGTAVGFLLRKAGYRITGVAARTIESARAAATLIGEGEPTVDGAGAASAASIVFITTPDRVIADVCRMLVDSGACRPGTLLIHMSGAHPLGLLDPALGQGCYRAVLHPLQSLASREQGIQTLPGSYFRIEADDEALDRARELVKALGGSELELPQWSSDRESAALYHAGAVAVSNYFVGLVAYGLKFYQALGAGKNEALKAVLPLIRGTLQNIETLGIPDALTGPIMRGDITTVREHLAAMANRAPELMQLYRELARETISVAQDKGSISPAVARQLLEVVHDGGQGSYKQCI